MRVMVYGILGFIASLILVDTNIGRPISHSRSMLVEQSIAYIEKRHFASDARELRGILRSHGLRESWLISAVLERGEPSSQEVSYYAYTPILSRSAIFLGGNFWRVGVIGRSSVLLHELTHIRYHRSRLLRGFPRSDDEAHAYLRQYKTYRALGLQSSGEDGVVYWDMMIGVRRYALPRYPAYAKRRDIQDSVPFIGPR